MLDFRSTSAPTESVVSVTRAFPFPHPGWKEGVVAVRTPDGACFWEPGRGELLLGDATEATLVPGDDPACRSAAEAAWSAVPLVDVRYTGMDPLRRSQLQVLGYVVP